MIVLWVAALVLFALVPLAGAQMGNPDLIGQAKKEGKMVWYTTLSIPESKQFADSLEKQFPFIKVEIFRSGAGAIVNRIFSEYGTKNYQFDVAQAGGSPQNLR